MKLLVIGGCHTYGFGVDFGKGFVQQVAQELGKSTTEITLEYYAPAKMSRIGPLLAHLGTQLGEYDLILLQLGHYEVIHSYFRELFQPLPADQSLEVYAGHIVLNHQTRPASVHWFHEKLKTADYVHQPYCEPNGYVARLRRWGKQATLKLAHRFGRIERLAYMERMLTEMLMYLNPYRKRVILVTPMPVQDKLMNQLRRMASAMFVKQAQAADATVIDSFRSLNLLDSVLLPDGCHLNSFGHAQLTEAVLLACRHLNLLPAQTATKTLWRELQHSGEAREAISN
ncbi:SGNH/GDSL hydrolase family protein [Spirosoma areae]